VAFKLVATRTPRRKRKAAKILLFPALGFIFLIGWLLYSVGDQKSSRRKLVKPQEKENVTFLPANFDPELQKIEG